jgi:hypothetical protein
MACFFVFASPRAGVSRDLLPQKSTVKLRLPPNVEDETDNARWKRDEK